MLLPEYSLTSIAGLGGIASGSINNLGITNNGALTDCNIQNLSGLNNITSVSEKLVIAENHRLLTLNGLDSLTSVGFYFYIGGLDDWPYSFAEGS